MATGVVSWSQTAASNANSDSTINWAEGMAASQVDDSARAMMASVAKYRDDIAGSLVAGGSSTAYTVTSNQGFANFAQLDGQRLTIRFNATNTIGSPTLNVDGLGARSINVSTTQGVVAGAVQINSVRDLTYVDASGCFILHDRPLSMANHTFTTSGTYTPGAGMAFVLVRLIGGGGGGGGAAASPSGVSSGGGGDAGGYAEAILTAAQVGASQTVTIGAGGTGGVTGNNQGGTGGTTSLGTLVRATGGTGGTGAAANQTGQTGGTPGSGNIGDIQLIGSAGSAGMACGITSVRGPSGTGGAAALLSGTTPGVVSGAAAATNGNGASSFGAGGAGGQVNGSASTAAGGVGGQGYLTIIEFTA
jgi:hypothetical protein